MGKKVKQEREKGREGKGEDKGKGSQGGWGGVVKGCLELWCPC